MATNKIMFGGNVLPCTVERFPDIHKAQRKFRQYNIPGRNGDIFFQSDAWENVIQSYQIYAGDGTYGSQTPWTELTRCLYLDGYQELRDTYDPTHFRKAVFNGPIDVENSWNTHGRATIEFNCRPERYLVDGNNPIEYEHHTSAIHLWLVSDLSAFLQSDFVGIDEVYAVTVPAGAYGRILAPNWRDDGQRKKYVSITPGQETTAEGSTSTSTLYNTITLGLTSRTYLIPANYYDGEPVMTLDGEVIGAAATLVNPYMPSHPYIVLHNIASHSGEQMVFQLNNKTVYIDYRAETPYYFIDTENYSVTCSDSLNGERIPATNVYLSADIKLLSGANSIFTSEWYDATISPNWWEL